MGQKNSIQKRQMTSTLKKIAVVGDGACGKTSLCVVFNKGEFPTDHILTILENRLSNIDQYYSTYSLI
jgi:GTPase SAR1 family protein